MCRPQRLRRDARAAITPSPQPLMKSNSERSNTTNRCRSMTASKIAPSSGALTRSAWPRIATTARVLAKPTVTANSPRRSLGAVTSASLPPAARSGASLMRDHADATGSRWDSPERSARVPDTHAENVSGDSTGLDTKSLPPNGG